MTETPTQTPTPTPTNQPLFAYLLIEPQAASATFNGWMASQGSSFRGFWINSPTTANPITFNNQMNAYLSYSGWNGTAPQIITGTISTINGGTDSFGNPIEAYKFQTTEVIAGTVANAWFTWFISTGSTNGQKLSQIATNTSGNPTALSPKNMNSALYNLTVNYSGSSIPTDIYRVYSTNGAGFDFRINGSSANIYFRGNTLIP